MIYDPAFLDRLQERESGAWDGQVFRHMFGAHRPEQENTLGARWNPPNVAAIYTSLECQTVKAESTFQLDSQPLRPRARRTVYRIRVVLTKSIALSFDDLALLGVDSNALKSVNHCPCQKVGGAVAWLGYDGFFVPSARHAGTNLVILPANHSSECCFEVLDSKVLDHS